MPETMRMNQAVVAKFNESPVIQPEKFEPKEAPGARNTERVNCEFFSSIFPLNATLGSKSGKLMYQSLIHTNMTEIFRTPMV
jgi:hypothetical protein